jgi:Protein of unknown function (DUF1570)
MIWMRINLLLLVLLVCAGSGAAPSREAASQKRLTDSAQREEIVALYGGQRRPLQGRILVEASAGNLLLQTDDGALWLLESDQILSRTPLDESFEAVTPEDLGEQLLAELPSGFRVHATPHYVVCYNTSRAYAQWTSSLLERLYKAFTNYWQNQGFELQEPEFPLPVLVFNDRQTYERFSREDLPAGVGNIVGFYSLRSNRVNMFDLTGGGEAMRGSGSRRGSMREINQMLSQPEAVPLVATIVHEATHQIAFNCGLSSRYADIPLWLCEGMAVYFEAPDLTSTRGWQGIGRVNYPRLTTFRDNLNSWESGSIARLVADNRRFRDPRTAVDAYADAWALNFYLIKYKPKAYTSYLKLQAAKPPLVQDDPQKRLAEFRDHFGDLDDLERVFLKQMSRVR